jgi:hypothetical protein
MISRPRHFRLLVTLIVSLISSLAVAQSPRTSTSAHTSAAPSHPAELYDPVAQPRAVVKAGHARFTILTPQLIRMEWAADGKFEDHPSLVFLNRNLPVPKFSQMHENAEELFAFVNSES